MRTNLVIIEGAKFIYDTNFSGDPKRDRFGNDQRKANLIIPDIEQARRLIDEGYNVKLTKPREGEESGFQSLQSMFSNIMKSGKTMSWIWTSSSLMFNAYTTLNNITERLRKSRSKQNLSNSTVRMH